MSVAQSAMLTIWFSGAEMNFAFALCVSTGRIASIINSYTAPWLYSNYSLELFCLTSAMLCCVSLLNGVGCYVLDLYAEAKFKKVKADDLDKSIKENEKKGIEISETEKTKKSCDSLRFVT